MAFLKGKKLYLSSPIEAGNDASWCSSVKEYLTKEFGIDVYVPSEDPKQQFAVELRSARDNKDFDTMRRIAKGFVQKDLGKLDRCDILMANLPYSKPTTGVHHEIFISNMLKKPCLLCCENGREYLPLWYWGFIKPDFMFGSREDVYSYLKEVNEGKHKHNSRWHFVYELI